MFFKNTWHLDLPGFLVFLPQTFGGLKATDCLCEASTALPVKWKGETNVGHYTASGKESLKPMVSELSMPYLTKRLFPAVPLLGFLELLDFILGSNFATCFSVIKTFALLCY